jgi:Putative zinc-finger
MSHLGHWLSALIDGELGPAQRDRVLAHLAGCESCRAEAASLRLLKQRMHALGEATANSSLHERLLALAAMSGPPTRGRWWRAVRRPARRRPAGYPLAGRARWPVRSLTVAGFMLLGAGVPAAAFLAGGAQHEPGPSVTPAVDLFGVQHAIAAGQVPAARTQPGQPGATPAARRTSSAGKAGTAAGTRRVADGSAATAGAVAASPGSYRRAARTSPKLRVLSPAAAGAGGR